MSFLFPSCNVHHRSLLARHQRTGSRTSSLTARLDRCPRAAPVSFSSWNCETGTSPHICRATPCWPGARDTMPLALRYFSSSLFRTWVHSIYFIIPIHETSLEEGASAKKKQPCARPGYQRMPPMGSPDEMGVQCGTRRYGCLDFREQRRVSQYGHYGSRESANDERYALLCFGKGPSAIGRSCISSSRSDAILPWQNAYGNITLVLQ
jgi:hypothetical protein